MKRTQTVTLLILCVFLIFQLTACGKAQPDPIEKTANATAAPSEAVMSFTPAEQFAGGSGSQDDPYQIATAEQLALLAKQVNAGGDCDNYYLLTADISLNDTQNLSEWGSTAPENEWIPIGNRIGVWGFHGCFDGDGHCIRGMYVNAGSEGANRHDYVGLFGKCFGATICNLTVCDSYVEASNCTNAAILVGEDNGKEGRIVNCTVESSTLYANAANIGDYAGICASSAGEIVSCTNAAEITVDARSAAGICAAAGTVTDCTNNGRISGFDAAGIASSADRIENCRNTGAVIGENCAGGIISVCLGDSFVTGCINDGSVSASGSFASAGGICGSMSASATFIGGEDGIGSMELVDRPAEVENCTNNGQISGVGYTGGVVGNMHGERVQTTLRGCINNGAVSASGESGGGVVGYLSSYNGGTTASILDCTNNGSVVPSGKLSNGLGGLVGTVNTSYNGTTNICGCTNTADLLEECNIGGIMYLATGIAGGELHITDCRNSGKMCNYGASSFLSGITSAVVMAATDGEIEDAPEIEKCSVLVEVDGCRNDGEIVLCPGNTSGGGIVGRALITDSGTDCQVTITDCVNVGELNVNVGGYSRCGGIVGEMTATEKTVFTLRGCKNEAVIAAAFDSEGYDLEELEEASATFPTIFGGIVGQAVTTTNCFEDCANDGTISVSGLLAEVAVQSDICGME